MAVTKKRGRKLNSPKVELLPEVITGRTPVKERKKLDWAHSELRESVLKGVFEFNFLNDPSFLT